MSPWRRLSQIALIALILPLFSFSRSASAAEESGWFDTPAAPASPPAQTQPAPSPVPAAPLASEMPSLAPSPLLEEGGAPYAPPETIETDADPRALSDFRPTLDPYGYWTDHPNYGTVWIPHREVVGPNFAPYVSSGRWALDDTGQWIWVSDYPFGRVVFHYGRWAWVTGTGWAWVPGYRYAPAWVTWRVPTGSYAYVGWAPMGPDYIWYNGVAVSYWYGAPTPWVFCPSVYVFHRHVNHYVVRDRTLVTRIASTTRHYAPAAPRASGGVRRTAYVPGPSLSAARVPAHAVPRDRVQARPLAGTSLAPRAIAPRAGAGRPLGPDRATGSFGRRAAPGARGTPERALPPPQRTRPNMPAGQAEQGRRLPVRRAEPAERREPVQRAEPPRRIEPVQRAEPPRRVEPVQRAAPPRRSEPSRRIAPPSKPRGGADFQRRALPRGQR